MQHAIIRLFPVPCVLCGKIGENLLCHGCHAQFFGFAAARCIQCALPLCDGGTLERCGKCLKNPPFYDFTVVACDYMAPFDQLVLALKFAHHLEMAVLFAELLSQVLPLQTPDQLASNHKSNRIDILCPVPLGAQRLRERGFNQSHEIAKKLSARCKIRLDSGLILKTRETVQQSSLSFKQRKKNVRNAYTLNPASDIRGRHIAVCDDVMTTGTTLNEIARILKLSGARLVSNYVFARTVQH